MLLDCFHPVRSLRYHDRRRAFIRKFKNDKTPTRYMTHLHDASDPEDTEEFDDCGPWQRGTEWRFINSAPPASLETSAWTAVPLFPDATRDFDDFLTVAGQVAQRKEIVTMIKDKETTMVKADMVPVPEMVSSISNSTIGDILRSPQTSPTEPLASLPEVDDTKQAEESDAPTVDQETKPVESVEPMHPCFFADPAVK